jgi:hypothetical protein
MGGAAQPHGAPGLIRTTRGVIATATRRSDSYTGPEAVINESLGLAAGQRVGAAAAAGGSASSIVHAPTGPGLAPHATFGAAARFEAHASGVLLASALRAEATTFVRTAALRPAYASQPRSPFGEWLAGTRPAASLPAVRRSAAAAGTVSTASLAARLPRRAVTLSLDSSLRRLRASVRTEAERRRPFLLNFHPLLPGDADRRESLGLALDLRGPSIQRCQ